MKKRGMKMLTSALVGMILLLVLAFLFWMAISDKLTMLGI
jgi:hypothetical protein